MGHKYGRSYSPAPAIISQLPPTAGSSALNVTPTATNGVTAAAFNPSVAITSNGSAVATVTTAAFNGVASVAAQPGLAAATAVAYGPVVERDAGLASAVTAV